jgi:hypothetical protein
VTSPWLEHSKVRHERIRPRWIVELGERLSGQHRDESNDRAALLRHQDPPLCFAAATVKLLTVSVGDLFARTKSTVDRSVEFLQLYDASPERAGISRLVLTDVDMHQRRCYLA